VASLAGGGSVAFGTMAGRATLTGGVWLGFVVWGGSRPPGFPLEAAASFPRRGREARP